MVEQFIHLFIWVMLWSVSVSDVRWINGKLRITIDVIGIGYEITETQSEISLERLRKIKKRYRYPLRDSNRAPTACKSETLSLDATSSVIKLVFVDASSYLTLSEHHRRIQIVQLSLIMFPFINPLAY
jgi:hypothetical protein